MSVIGASQNWHPLALGDGPATTWPHQVESDSKLRRAGHYPPILPVPGHCRSCSVSLLGAVLHAASIWRFSFSRRCPTPGLGLLGHSSPCAPPMTRAPGHSARASSVSSISEACLPLPHPATANDNVTHGTISRDGTAQVSSSWNNRGGSQLRSHLSSRPGRGPRPGTVVSGWLMGLFRVSTEG